MKTFDKYIARQFITNFVIIFAVLCLLIITLDLLINIDEFIQAAERLGGSAVYQSAMVAYKVFDFYGPLTLLFFVYMGGLICVASMGFTLTQMIRNNELVALLAGGVSLYRIAVTFILLAVFCCLSIFCVQEFVLPGLADKLVRSQADVKNEISNKFSNIYYVRDSQGSLFSTERFDPVKGTMDNLTIRVRKAGESSNQNVMQIVQHIYAERAEWFEEGERKGWQLEEVIISDRPRPGEPRDADIARQTEHASFFYPTDLDPKTVVSYRNSTFRGLLSLPDLRDLMFKPKIVEVRDLVRIVHVRFSLLALNVLVMMIGLHFFLVRAPDNMLLRSIKALVVCAGSWVGAFLMMQGGLTPLPTADAWLPVMINIPVAYYYFVGIES